MPLRILRRNVNTSNFTPLSLKISPAGYPRQAFIKLKYLGNIGCENWKYMWFYTWFRFIFWRNISWRMLKQHFRDSRFQNFLGEHAPDPSRGSCLRRSLPWTSPFRYPFFTFLYTVRLPRISCQISIYYEVKSAHFLDLYFCESTAAISFPRSNDVIFSKILHVLKL